MMLNAPGRSITLHPSRGRPLAAFIFWHREIGDFDHSDSEQHKRIVVATFGDLAWKVPQILDAVRASGELYFDSVSRVQMTIGRAAGSHSSATHLPAYRCSATGRRSPLRELQRWRPRWRRARRITTGHSACIRRSTASLSRRNKRTCRWWRRSSCRKRGSGSRCAIAPCRPHSRPTAPSGVSDGIADLRPERPCPGRRPTSIIPCHGKSAISARVASDQSGSHARYAQRGGSEFAVD